MDSSPTGYLHNKTTVKVLILYILARIESPLTWDALYEVALQDDSLSYFTFHECLPELVSTGHLRKTTDDRYEITEQGRLQGATLEDTLAVPVIRKVTEAITQKNEALRKASYTTTEILPADNGSFLVRLHCRDQGIFLMDLTLFAPNREMADIMARNMQEQSSALYQQAVQVACQDPSKTG